MFSPSKNDQEIESLKKKIELLLAPFKDKNDEVDFDLLSKNQEALSTYRELSLVLHQLESAAAIPPGKVAPLSEKNSPKHR